MKLFFRTRSTSSSPAGNSVKGNNVGSVASSELDAYGLSKASLRASQTTKSTSSQRPSSHSEDPEASLAEEPFESTDVWISEDSVECVLGAI
eukprot:Nitzschia sp. Nitz4//scaffold273_size25297//11171//11446//NITZ4_008318-RA/size25297-processed-gene-0.22-mRNA-1//-1//CDS//3329545253//5571//frame0